MVDGMPARLLMNVDNPLDNPDLGRTTLRAMTATLRPQDGPLTAPVVFTERPAAVPARQRIAYRTASLVLTLGTFNRSAASIANLHLLTWAQRSRRTRAVFLAWWSGRRFADMVTVRIEPDLELTLNLARAHTLIATMSSPGRVKLTDQGQALRQLIVDDEGTLAVEKQFLAQLTKLSDSTLTQRLGGTF